MCATQIQRLNKAHLSRLLLFVGHGGPAALLGRGSLQHQEAQKVREMPTHHSVIWASPKIIWPRKACGETDSS